MACASSATQAGNRLIASIEEPGWGELGAQGHTRAGRSVQGMKLGSVGVLIDSGAMV